MKVIDLFCGAGGMSWGFKEAGFEVALGVDKDPSMLRTFSLNHKNSMVMERDLGEVGINDIAERFGRGTIDVIIGGPPCQGFSIANRFHFKNDPRNLLYKTFVRAVDTISPDWFVMENVPNLIKMGFHTQIMEDFSEIGYKTNTTILNAVDYGVPQQRRRCFFVGNKAGKLFQFPPPTHFKYLTHSLSGKSMSKQALAGDVLKYEFKVARVSKRRKIIWVSGSNPPPCIRRKGEEGSLDLVLWNKPSPTILAQTGSWNLDGPYFCDGDNVRQLTWRECATLQGFPSLFQFPGSNKETYHQIGNAVPPPLSKVIALKIKETLNND